MTERTAMREASTVVLVRDGSAGLEVFLQRRVQQMAFAGGMTVFPGGGVDARDADADLDWSGPGPDEWARWFDVDAHNAQALVCAAVRETFEECGVLLASTPAGVFGDPAAMRTERAALVDKSLSLAGFLREHGMVLRADLLRPMAHWVTPVVEKRRYDTKFFLAAVPPGQEPDDETSEADVARWVRPADALASWRAGQHVLLPPTWTQLRDLESFTDVAAALAQPRTIKRIEPSVGDGDGLASLRFPDCDDYFADREHLPDLS